MELRDFVSKQSSFSRVFENVDSREALGSMHCSKLSDVFQLLWRVQNVVLWAYVG
jgi:hypothetical protein